MDFKKIFEASKWPIIAVALLNILNPVFNPFTDNQLVAFVAPPSFLLSLALTFWVGFNGVKKHKFDYSDSVIAGVMLGIIAALASLAFMVLLILMGFQNKLFPLPDNMATTPELFVVVAIILVSILSGMVGVTTAMLVTSIGAFIAKKLK